MKTQSDNRIWEIDALRGFLILLVMFDHAMWDLGWSGIVCASAAGRWLQSAACRYLDSPLRMATHDGFVVVFVLLSGVCSNFARSNLKRGLRLAAFAVGLTAVSLALQYFTKSQDMAIYFGILHCLAVCQLIFAALERFKCPGAVILLLGAAGLILGYYFAYAPAHIDAIDWRYPFIYNNRWQYNCADFWPLFPFLGWFLTGSVIGGLIYRDRVSVADGRVRPACRWLEFIGRHSLYFYLGSQAVIYGLFYALTAWCGL